jgi:DNA-directed RNA polymerase
MHSQPLLEQLHESFEARYENIRLSKPPPSGDLRLEEVRKSVYFFS